MVQTDGLTANTYFVNVPNVNTITQAYNSTFVLCFQEVLGDRWWVIGDGMVPGLPLAGCVNQEVADTGRVKSSTDRSPTDILVGVAPWGPPC